MPGKYIYGSTCFAPYPVLRIIHNVQQQKHEETSMAPGWNRAKIGSITLAALFCMALLSACNYSGIEIDRSNSGLLSEAVANTMAAQTYHLAIRDNYEEDVSFEATGEVDARRNRSRFETGDTSSATKYVVIDDESFVSDDGGRTFYSEGDARETVDTLFPQLRGFDPGEAEKAGAALRDAEPAIESIDGVLTKHMVVDYAALPSLVDFYTDQMYWTPNTIDVWVTLGPSPTMRRLKIQADEDDPEASSTLEWSRLNEPTTIDAPEVAQTDNVDLLTKAAANMNAATGYNLEADLLQDDISIYISGEVDVANRSSSLYIDTEGVTLDLITVDGEAYLSMDDGKTYSRSELGNSLTSSISEFTGVWDEFKGVNLNIEKNLIKDGDPATELIYGVRTKHITMTADPFFSLTAAGGNSASPATMDIWVSIEPEPYIYQMAVSGIIDGQRIDGTFNWSRFNENFQIEAPDVDQSGGSSTQQQEPPRITLTEFKALYDEPAKRPLIIDVRSRALYDQGHIAGAISFPEADLDARVGELPKNRLIVAYCQ